MPPCIIVSSVRRTWEPSVGKENFPDGEVFTAPIETKVDGTIRFTYPAVFQGREVNDVELRFEGGEVVDSSASHGLEFLREMIAMDAGARRLGGGSGACEHANQGAEPKNQTE